MLASPLPTFLMLLKEEAAEETAPLFVPKNMREKKEKRNKRNCAIKRFGSRILLTEVFRVFPPVLVSFFIARLPEPKIKGQDVNRDKGRGWGV